MIYFLLVETAILSILSKLIYKRVITAYTLILIPYVAIVVFNNAIFARLGFLKVRDNAILLIIGASFFFFIGVLLASKISFSFMKGNLYCEVNKRGVITYAAFVIALRIIEITYKISKVGLSNVSNNDFEVLINKGLTGHLMLSIFPFMPIVFYEWVENKKELKYLILYLVYILVCFAETEKAQAIAPIIAAFLFCSYKNEKYIKKGIVIIVLCVLALFIGNYATKFIFQGFYKSVPLRYYLYRLWNYIAGGVINSGTVIDSDITTNAFDYLRDVVFAFPNMITDRLLGFKIGGTVKREIDLQNGFLRTTSLNDSWGYQDNNVYGTLSLMYGNGNILAFGVIAIIWGWVSQLVYNKMRYKKEDQGFLVCVCYMTFSFLSFFSSYYIFSSFLERILWCVLLCHFFRKRHRDNVLAVIE